MLDRLRYFGFLNESQGLGVLKHFQRLSKAIGLACYMNNLIKHSEKIKTECIGLNSILPPEPLESSYKPPLISALDLLSKGNPSRKYSLTRPIREGVRRKTSGVSPTACHSSIAPHSIPRRYLQPRKRIRQSPAFTEYENSNYLQLMPTTQLQQGERKDSRRGDVTCMSSKSMRNMKRSLAKVRKDLQAFTFCLSYGETFPDAGDSKAEFIKWQRWICRHYPGVGLYWKREPQKRRATHYHLLAFIDATEDDAKAIGQSMVVKWCEIANDQYGGDQFSKALKVHTHDSNFQRMEGDNFFNYLGKYISKTDDSMPDGYDLEGGGRWWGVINRKAIPYGKEVERTNDDLSRKDGKMLERICYRLRQDRANRACDIGTSELVKEKVIDSFNNEACRATVELANAFPNMRPQDLRKAVRAHIDPSKRWRKARRLYREGSVTLLGNTEHIKASLDRWKNQDQDHEARRRIFGDDATNDQVVPDK